MSHNPHNLKEGQRVILDKDFANTSEVIIFHMGDYDIFSTVYAVGEPEYKWEVMTTRLSPIEQTKLLQEEKKELQGEKVEDGKNITIQKS